MVSLIADGSAGRANDSQRQHESFWAAAFYAACLVGLIAGPIQHYGFPLHSASEVFFGLATQHGIDIAARIRHFYLWILGFGILLLLLFGLLNSRIFEFIHRQPQASLITVFSISGLLLCIGSLLSLRVQGSIALLLSANALLYVTALFHRALPLRQSDIADALILGLGTLVVLNAAGLGLSLVVMCMTFFLFAAAFLCLIAKSARKPALTPLYFGPLFCILASEAEYFFAARIGISIPYGVLLLLALGILVALVLLRMRDDRTTSSGAHLYYGLGSLLAYILYSALPSFDGRLFEPANYVLPVQQWYEFGKVPLLQNFSSHALSDAFFPFIHTLIFGYSTLNLLNYGFFENVMALLLATWFLGRFAGNTHFAVLFALLSPFYERSFPPYFAYALGVVLVFDWLRAHLSYRRAICFWLACAVLLAWRIDLGFAACAAALALMALELILDPNRAKVRLFALSALATAAIVALPVISLALIIGVDLRLFVAEALSYLSSSQSYGLPDITPESQSLSFVGHYFLFPACAVLILSALYLKLRGSQHLELDQQFRILALLFLIVFYIANFQRGLVRHSFLEQDDIKVSSFALFFIPAAWGVLTQSQRHFPLLRFALASVLLTAAFRLNAVSSEASLLERLISKIESPPQRPETSRWLSGPVSPQFAAARYEDLKLFLDTHYPLPATFWDFSNSPLIYYFTHRDNPSLFPQNTLSLHSEYLQQRAIEIMHSADVPVVLFSNGRPDRNPRGAFNLIDGIPNALRHPHLARFIYANYAPWGSISGYSVWLEKSRALIDRDEHKELENLDARWKLLDNSVVHEFSPAISADAKRNYTVRLTSDSGFSDHEQLLLHVRFGTAVRSIPLEMSDSERPNSLVGAWRLRDTFEPERPISIEAVEMRGPSKLQNTRLSINAYTYLPDLHSQLAQHWQLGKIPRILGSSRSPQVGPGTLEIAADLELTSGHKVELPLLPQHKEYGYLLARVRVPSREIVTMRIGMQQGSRILGSFMFLAEPDERDSQSYIIPVGAQYNWHSGLSSSLNLELVSQNSEIQRAVVERIILVRDLNGRQ